MHALRHAYASVLLDAGESVKALSEYLGHSDPGFTLRTYTHLLLSSEARTRKAIDDAFSEAEPQEAGEPRAHHHPQQNSCARNVPWPPDGPSGTEEGEARRPPTDPHETPAQGHTRQYG
ncbi:tyrosine-type recombinase/integrase [Streptomyces javensis]|uniref:Tyr recombinase domain-containing protein n=1 Tax=Streptomyces javensis TaxID=114698 RepID=A0ABN1XAM7_9ACTN